MKCNIGKIDRIIRIVLGVVLLGAGLMKGWIIADILGVALLLTAAIGWCPPYALLGIDTGCKVGEDQPKED
ncbi:DUF2892 domain-containing protein [Sulfurovum sp. zt1-1]|uniref:DUF2892 domain-containing protein n=1 Tax=Sulfurovum zhangzhouensis TaxID=3019067 RepID=A0ABT7QWG2_9BACT|nr:DUF2892 domain-containing protein [Sulfurovum zhangzhouensis]MDM5271174.1 DUF2892 domain-containing protein [Sulfurovum zhangzhouensis]